VRLGFAVAINTKPDLLLIDEVLAVGDANFQRKCLDTIYRFRNEGGTLLLVTHDLATIQSMCNRAVWFDEGQIQHIGHPTDVAMSYVQRIAEEENRVRLLQRALEEEDADDAEESESEDVVLPEDEAAEESDDALANEEEEFEEEEVVVEVEKKQRWGTGEIEITDVEFLDGEENTGFVFHTGEPMEIRLYYRAEEPIDEPIFGLAIYKQDNTHVCGPNTKFGDLSIARIEGEGYLSYKIPELPLLEGIFFLSLAVIDQSDTITYDYLDRLYSFSVYPGKTQERYGMVTLLGEWEWIDSVSSTLLNDDLGLLDSEEDERFVDDLDDMAMLEQPLSENLKAVA